FGPNDDANICVGEVVEEMKKCWPEIGVELLKAHDGPHEANLLMLDCSKAKRKLGWSPILTPTQTFAMTANWYKDFGRSDKPSSRGQIQQYVDLVK
ncbi:MAG: hypothetical protein KAG61_11725, partial [Bacteriovoracaceae bacterium]|nr:hypothetical protein [Bacteriovoracaceae bacterium]